MGWLRKKKGRLMGGIKKCPSEKKGQVFFFYRAYGLIQKEKTGQAPIRKKWASQKKKKKGGKWAHKKMKKNAHFFFKGVLKKKKRRDFPIFWTSNFWPPSSYIA